ncbi:daptomycin-sensing surface protein LiaX [Vagococcus sp. BWB3-3]|uniref:Daptomycin-sensing surface protein LiaX n=1 Tax=Vagococcus allomyrinae TaxID=2794353 RepID=A0A940STM0_9ENTE|nr:daptomycin-sensing surface protein LiaX [Vagococcus allomyrinae]MBP1043272.1 daptomycin-sensing surface protein LiaX [Vagococcus allomyrinae]
MKERERVFELVKQGIITTEEALVLLENMATEKDEKIVKKEAQDVKKGPTKTSTESPEDKPFDESDLFGPEKDLEEAEEEAFQKFAANEAEDRQRLEKILDELATEANKTSAELDEVNVEIQGIEAEIKEKEEQLMVLNTIEELDELAEDKVAERTKIEEELSDLNANKTQLEVEKEAFEEKLKTIRKEQKEGTREQWSKKFEIPSDWEESFTDFGQKMGEAGTQFGRKMGEAGNQLGRFFKDTIKTVTETVNDNVDWKDINIKVPGVATNSFQHEFYYPETAASLIDVKVANGEVTFSTWESADLKVVADIKLYGKMDADTPFEAFLERSQIDVDDETISFQIPNKRIRADLHFYLPTRVYDHISVKLLNGDVNVETLEAKDVFMKSTNGDMTFKNLTATMLEVEGVNGDVTVSDSDIMDFLAESVNGDFVVQSKIENANISNVNGDIKVTAQKENLKKIEAKVVNGAIKVAIPKEVGIEALAKTSLGSIKNRIGEFEVIREKKEKTNQMLQFRRYNEEQTVYIRLSTTTGSVYLKDADQ